MSTLAVLAGLAVLNILIAAALLWLLARAFGATRATYARACIAVLLIAAASISVNVAILTFGIPAGWEAAAGFGVLVATLGAAWFVVGAVLGATRGRGAFLTVS